MAYKIGVASLDSEHIDVSFGAARTFLIYEVKEDNSYSLSEKRVWEETSCREEDSMHFCQDGRTKEGACASLGSGCGGANGNIPKLALVEDCRCIVCKKIGFQVQKQLERKAITSFDVEGNIGEALIKIISYFDRVDNHRSLRGL